MLSYEFKNWPELAWGVLVAAAVFVLQILVSTDFNAVTDWHAWLVALAAGALRAAVGALIAKLNGSGA